VAAPIVIFTRLTATPGRGGELLAILEELAIATRSEPGNEVFVFHAARDEPDVVLGYEVFTDDDALAAHRATDAVRVTQERLGSVLTEPPQIDYAR
jgi:quinol monooxygenase YgiN